MNKSLRLQELPFTGERLVTSQGGEHTQMVFEHLHRYYLAADLCVDRVVLDIASGEGYGSNLLAQKALSVFGVDSSAKAIRHSAAKYHRKNLRFLVGNCLKIPLPENAVDVVVSFETIEHISEHETFLAEIRRVLRPDGVLVISSPDKAEYSDRYGQNNSYHVRELYRRDFLGMLGRQFKNCLPMQQRLVAGSYIAADTLGKKGTLTYGTHRGDFNGGTFEEGVHEGIYCIAVCTDGQLPDLKLGLFENRLKSAQIWNTFETAPQAIGEIQELRNKLASLEDQIRSRELDSLTAVQAAKLNLSVLRLELEATRSGGAAMEDKLAEANAEIVRRGEWGRRLDQELAGLREALVHRDVANEQLRQQEQDLMSAKAAMEDKLAEANAEIVRRGEWGRRLDQELAGLQAALVHRETELTAANSQLELTKNEMPLSDRRSSQENLFKLETDLAKKRELIDLQEVKITALRLEADRKHATILDLTEKLGANELDRDQFIVKFGETQLQALEQVRQSQQESRDKIRNYEEQLAAAQSQLTAALMDNQKIALGSIAHTTGRERAQMATLLQSDHELRQIKTSWSWRITSPLRKLHQALGDPLYQRR